MRRKELLKRLVGGASAILGVGSMSPVVDPWKNGDMLPGGSYHAAAGEEVVIHYRHHCLHRRLQGIVVS